MRRIYDARRARPHAWWAALAAILLAVTAAAPVDAGPSSLPTHAHASHIGAHSHRHVVDADLDVHLHRRAIQTGRYYRAVTHALDNQALRTLAYLHNRAVAEQRARDARNRASHATRYASAPAQYGSGACGGDLPPCSVMRCESGGNLTIWNANGSSASGKWQITEPTWDNYMGYPNAASAPEWVQDKRAAEIYAGGAGRSQWSC